MFIRPVPNGSYLAARTIQEFDPMKFRGRVLAKVLALSIVPLTLICLVSNKRCLAAPQPETSGMVLTGLSSQYGKTQCSLSPQGISIVGVGGIIWNVKKPTRFLSINQENKTFFDHSIHDGRLSRALSQVFMKKAQLIGKTTLHGQTCSHYLGFRLTDCKQLVQAVDFWTIDKTSLPDDIIRQWCAFFSMPPDYGLPIQVRALPGLSWPHGFLLTECKSSPIANSNFDAPAHYKQVKDRGALYFSQDGESLKATDIEEIFSQPLK
jgi:hypothetical protein